MPHLILSTLIEVDNKLQQKKVASLLDYLTYLVIGSLLLFFMLRAFIRIRLEKRKEK